MPEDWLRSVMTLVNDFMVRSAVRPPSVGPRRQYLGARYRAEQRELMFDAAYDVGVRSPEEMRGRISGSIAWRLERGELGEAEATTTTSGAAAASSSLPASDVARPAASGERSAEVVFWQGGPSTSECAKREARLGWRRGAANINMPVASMTALGPTGLVLAVSPEGASLQSLPAASILSAHDSDVAALTWRALPVTQILPSWSSASVRGDAEGATFPGESRRIVTLASDPAATDALSLLTLILTDDGMLWAMQTASSTFVRGGAVPGRSATGWHVLALCRAPSTLRSLVMVSGAVFACTNTDRMIRWRASVAQVRSFVASMTSDSTAGTPAQTLSEEWIDDGPLIGSAILAGSVSGVLFAAPSNRSVHGTADASAVLSAAAATSSSDEEGALLVRRWDSRIWELAVARQTEEYAGSDSWRSRIPLAPPCSIASEAELPRPLAVALGGDDEARRWARWYRRQSLDRIGDLWFPTVACTVGGPVCALLKPLASPDAIRLGEASWIGLCRSDLWSDFVGSCGVELASCARTDQGIVISWPETRLPMQPGIFEFRVFADVSPRTVVATAGPVVVGHPILQDLRVIRCSEAGHDNSWHCLPWRTQLSGQCAVPLAEIPHPAGTDLAASSKLDLLVGDAAEPAAVECRLAWSAALLASGVESLRSLHAESGSRVGLRWGSAGDSAAASSSSLSSVALSCGSTCAVRDDLVAAPLGLAAVSADRSAITASRLTVAAAWAKVASIGSAQAILTLGDAVVVVDAGGAVSWTVCPPSMQSFATPPLGGLADLASLRATAPEGVKTATPETTVAAARAAQARVQQFFKMLTSGCGSASCSSPHCVSSGKQASLAPNAAALQAVRFASDASVPVCEGLSR